MQNTTVQRLSRLHTVNNDLQNCTRYLCCSLTLRKYLHEKKLHQLLIIFTIKAKFPHSIYACVYRVALDFEKAYFGCSEQCELDRNAIKCCKYI